MPTKPRRQKPNLHPRPLLRLLFVFFAASSLLLFLPLQLNPRRISHGGATRLEADLAPSSSAGGDVRSCPALVDGTDVGGGEKGILCCDRSHHRTDVCYMRGDIRTNSANKTIMLHNSGTGPHEEKIRPYTRKWEKTIMSTVDELTLVPVPAADGARCDVRHNVTGVVFSSGGYTGNVYHEFNDGMLPLFLTVERFRGEVVLVVVEYHQWWFDKYQALIGRLSNHPVVDFRRDKRVHCFPEMIVGLRIHGELSIHPHRPPAGKSMEEFQGVMERAWGEQSERTTRLRPLSWKKKPTIVLLVRHASRVVVNMRSLARYCETRLRFRVRILEPKRSSPLSDIYAALHAADVMVAVHGAALTHFLFMRPGSVVVQVVPLGLDWAANEYYGQPARRLGLEYMEYKVSVEESSLSKEYRRNDPVLSDPAAITRKGWQETKRIYLQHQNVTLDLKRFGKLLSRARSYVNTHRRSAISLPE